MIIQEENALTPSQTRRRLEKLVGTKKAKMVMRDLYNGTGCILTIPTKQGLVIEKFDPFGMTDEKSIEATNELKELIRKAG